MCRGQQRYLQGDEWVLLEMMVLSAEKLRV
jgi:hypothetical protein